MSERSISALESLERSKATLGQLVEDAAKIVGADFISVSDDVNSHSLDSHAGARYTFKEQWILRWLLRRFIAPDTTQANGTELDPTTSQLLDPRPWKLLLHLLRTIPAQTLTELLVERRFGTQFSETLARYLEVRTQADGSNAISSNVAPNGIEHERSPKRRRLSPSPESKLTTTSIDKLVLEICAVCVGLGGSAHNDSQDSFTALWSSVDSCATFVSQALRLALSMLEDNVQTESTASSVQTILSLWDSWKSAGGILNTANAKAFNKTCLSLCLEIGTALRPCKSPTCKNAKTAIEAQIARATVLPLRERFNKKYLKQWRSVGGCLTWTLIEPFAKEVRDFLSPLSDRGVARRADLLFDVAMRLIPKYDIRTRQREQPWVDALLVGLAYFACPGLEKLDLERRSIVILDSIKARELTDHQSTLTELLGITSSGSCTPSIEATSYLAGALSASRDFERPWPAIASLMDMNSETLMPNTLLPTSGHALNELTALIADPGCVVDAADYEVLRDRVVIPVLRSFATSRALLDFTTIWKPNLQEAIRVSRPVTDNAIPAVMIWDSDEIFDEFKKQVVMSTSTVVVESILSELRPSLEEMSTKAGTLLDCFATTAIATPLVGLSRSSDDADSAEYLATVLGATVRALQRKTDFQGKRWRLWRLIAAAQHAKPDLRLPVELIGGDSPQACLADAEMHEGNANWSQECFLRFRVLAKEGLTGSEPYRLAFEKELASLQSLIERLLKSKASSASSGDDAWDGRSLTLSTLQKLASACLGILLANQNLLGRNRAFSEAVLRMSLDFWEAEMSADDVSAASLSRLLQAVAQASVDASEGDSVKQPFRAVHEQDTEPTDADLQALIKANKLAMGKMRPQYLRGTVEKQFQLLTALKLKKHRLSDIAAILGFLNWVGTTITTSYTRAESWSDWKNISDKLTKAKSDALSFDFVVAARAMQDAADRVLQRAMRSDAKDATVANSIAQHTLRALEALLQVEGKVDVTNHLFELFAAQGICTGADTCKHLGGEMVTKVRGALASVVEQSVRDLTEDGALEKSPAKPLVLLEVANRLSGLASQHTKLHDIEQLVFDKESDTRDDCQYLRLMLNDKIRSMVASLPSSRQTQEGTDDAFATGMNSIGVLGGGSQADYHKAAAKVISFVNGLHPSDYAKCLELCVKNVDADHGIIDQFVVGAITRKISADHLERDEKLVLMLNTVASLSTEQSTTGQSSLLRLENANLVLSLHPRQISQATIDRLLARLCTFGSTSLTDSAGSITEPHLIIDRIFSIIGTLLSRFRRRLADRHHLLLPVLQQILRCFFYSPDLERRARQTTVTGSNPSSLLRSLPPWMRNSKSTLPPSSATTLSRILSSICNPTVSAAKSSSRRRGRSATSQLNDETKRVKTLAGQHMQYLVVEYCRCTLDGDLQPPVKEKLLPGMYVILDAMSRELMRSMNADMDPSSRALFRGLYDDWVRYGKWDKS
jgi:nucleolar pre-ribosomal-associated protein 2